MYNQNGNLIFERPPYIASFASVVGKKESEGPLHDYFDRIVYDSYAAQDTFEQAESELLSTAVRAALHKGDLQAEDIDLACCGDLLNQCVASSFGMRSFGIPYAGVYGACSTMALGMILSSVALECGAAGRAVCAASSHYCTAERQYRFPLEYGSQRPPTAQWTVTGAGACILQSQKAENNRNESSAVDRDRTLHHANIASSEHASARETDSDRFPQICSARFGKIVDFNITDQNNMGAAMAPAVVKLGTKILLKFEYMYRKYRF